MSRAFTGTWTFNRERSRLQIAAPDATVFVVDHRGPLLRISRTHFSGETRDTFSLDLTTDGPEVVVDRSNVRLRCRAPWEGDILVFETSVMRESHRGTNVVRYALSSDRNVLQAEERFRSDSLNYDNVWMLDRVETA